jgi:hypothetical protein
VRTTTCQEKYIECTIIVKSRIKVKGKIVLGVFKNNKTKEAKDPKSLVELLQNHHTFG